MANKLRRAALAFVVVTLGLMGSGAGIAANGNGNANANGNGNGNANGNTNADGQGTGNTTVTVCHNPSGDASTIQVNDNAVDAHLTHGDQLGPCAEPPIVEDVGGSQDDQDTTGGQANTSEPEEESAPKIVSFSRTPPSSSEPRSLFCSTRGPVDRGDGDPGVALNLFDSQGAFLVEKGLVSPAIFYAGVGVSCDHLPGFVDSGLWVDHVGDAVDGIGVYPYFVPAG